jgi:hypothetical protein
VDEFARCNARLHYSSNWITSPMMDDVLGRLGELLAQPCITDGTSPIAAARKAGFELFFGITHEPLADALIRCRSRAETILVRLDECWDAFGLRGHFPIFEVPHAVALAAGGRKMAYSNVIPPPYFVAFSCRQKTVARMMIMPIATAGGSIHSSDSGLETRFLQAAGEFGLALIKPAIPFDLSVLGPTLWPAELPAQLPHRPDGIVYSGGGIQCLEIQGSPRVAPIVESRLAAYREWARGSVISAMKLTAEDLSAPVDSAAWQKLLGK